MPWKNPTAKPPEGAETFNDVILASGRVAIVHMTDDALFVDTYRVRRWVAVVGTLALAAHLYFFVGTTVAARPPFFPWYVILMFASIWMHEKVRERHALADVAAIERRDRQVVIHYPADGPEPITIIPKSWQRSRFDAALREALPHAIDAQPPARAETTEHAVAAHSSWLPAGHTPLPTLGGAAALAVAVLLGGLYHLDTSFPRLGIDLARGAAALALVLWVQDASTRKWLTRQLERVGEKREARLHIAVRRGGGWRAWRKAQVEPTHYGFALVFRGADMFESVVVAGVAVVVATSLFGRVSIPLTLVAMVLLRTSGYPREREDTDEFLADDVREYEDEHGRGTLRLRGTEGRTEVAVRYAARDRDRWLVFLSEHAPDAHVHSPVRIRNLGAKRTSEATTDLTAVHERLRALDDEQRPISPDG